jgi:hypothetical protein
MQRRIITFVSLATIALPLTARADSFGEVVAGVAIPLGDDDYSDVVDESFKLGVRGGSMPAGGIGIEGGVDWTSINDDIGGEVLGQSFDVAWNRFRVLAGARFGKVMGGETPVLVFARAGAGIDLIHVSVTTEILGNETEDSETDTGLALEVGGGALVSLGSVAIGAQIAVPMGFHFEDDDGDASTFDADYTSYDLDILGTIATTF